MSYLYDYQKEAVEKLSNGKVLVGGVGTGKSRTALYWYFVKECHGEADEEFVPMMNPKPLYIITTAKKRDDCEWDKDMLPLLISSEDDYITVDSWNNIKKYADAKDSIFIFDEQRLVGSGTWVKTFYKIAKNNRWILLTATPGDTFKDYIPVFVANGFYRNKTDFETQHVEWDRFCKFPRYKKFHNTGKLIRFQREILVQMKPPKRTTEQIHIWRKCEYNHDKEHQAIMTRWDPYKNEPMQQASVLCYVLRRISNEDSSRLRTVGELIGVHSKVIIFYNFDYELNALRQYLSLNDVEFKEWNGHHHDSLPIGNRWAYLVQYTAGNEGWNCVTCDTIIFYSQNYSYKVMTQAAGRIDRLNTPYQFLNYYHLYSDSKIDTAIRAAVTKKKTFNEKVFKFAFEGG